MRACIKSWCSESILVYCGGIENLPKAVPSQPIRSEWPRILEKQFSIFESSGSITQIACRSGFGGSNARVMVGACATQEERYNRVGEIIMAYRDDSVDAGWYGALVLDGHKKSRGSSVVMRQTVTSVVYDPLTDLFVSGGYDGDVVAWSASKAVALDTIGSHPKPINSITCHSKRNLLAYGCQSGSVFCFNAFSELGSRHARSFPLFSKPKGKDSFSNTVDSVAIPSTGLRENTCYAGIGFLQSCAAGVVESWDLETGVCSGASESLPSGLTCMSLSSCGTVLLLMFLYFCSCVFR
jgi:WD40 repeat protein